MLDINQDLPIINNKRTAEDQNHDLTDPKKTRLELNIKKRKMCAILMMYSGVGYFGMQRNIGFTTIEGELFGALLATNLIDQASFDSPNKIRFQRASKTDRYVSASGQVCSIKIPDDDNAVEKLNSVLPKDIRIIDVFRTTKNFHAKSQCKDRTYRYITPSFAFSPKSTNNEDLFNYRISTETLGFVNETLSYYKGTHNFHNFTSGRMPTDKSCQRYITSLICEEPFVGDDVEYVTITVHGQSFMLHQIRKMIGLAMAVVRGFCDYKVFEKVYSLKKVDIPRAPGLGLILDKVNYDFYNSKHCSDGERKSIDWTKYEVQLSQFREKYIYSHIYRIEKEEKSMLVWLETLGVHSYRYRVDNASDTAPPEEGI